MTRVFCREYYDRAHITIEGHCGFAEKGSDVICAAVSALVYTLIYCLKEEESADRLKLIRCIVREGYVCIEAQPFDFSKERTDAIIGTCLLGLYMLAEEFPQYVKFE